MRSQNTNTIFFPAKGESNLIHIIVYKRGMNQEASNQP